MTNKKGVAFEFIVVAIIAIVVCIVIIFAFKGLFGKEAGATRGQIDQSGYDCDDDGVIDILDRCCMTGPGKDVGMDGCTGDEQESEKIGCDNDKNKYPKCEKKYKK
ncbi:hypothetical protein JXA85_07415 [Candidatus Woesearchaeota archaeon]|nr:hypothetical protein [Candidatus Woesearchaeota archaeon]